MTADFQCGAAKTDRRLEGERVPARSHVVFLDLEVVMRKCVVELPATKAF